VFDSVEAVLALSYAAGKRLLMSVDPGCLRVKPVLLDAAGERPCYPPLDGKTKPSSEIGPGAGRLLFSQ
jgi:hypothetical protein